MTNWIVLVLIVLGLMFNTLAWLWWQQPERTMSESIRKVLNDR